MDNSITPEYVRLRLHYDQQTGALRWRARKDCRRGVAAWNAKFAGTLAGRIDSTGYLQVALYGRRYPATHLIWMIVYGVSPTNFIDHRNRDRSDNRIHNLREATREENSRNCSGRGPIFKGVKRTSSKAPSWEARICFKGRYVYLGVFPTPYLAAQAYDRAAIEMHGEFAAPNFDRSAA